MSDASPPVAEAVFTGGEDLRVWVARALEGDREAAAEIYRRFFATVLAIQLGNTGGDRQLASDLTQDTFVKALYRLDQFHWQGPGSLRNWIAVIARNTFRDHVRSASNRYHAGSELPDREDPDEATNPAAVVDRDLDGARRDVARVLETLKPEHRQVLRRIVGEGATAAEVATELQRTEAAVHQLKRRAIDAARRSVGVPEVLARSP